MTRRRVHRKKRTACVCYAVPPAMLAEIVRRAPSPADRDRALATLAVSSQLKGFRAVASTLPSSLASRSPGTTYRMVYDGGNDKKLPGLLLRSEGRPPCGDAAADEAYDGAGVFWNFLKSAFGRDGIDGAGMAVVSTVHYARDFENAFWNGTQMVYGDGDGRLFERFTKSLDVVCHELAHGFTQHCSGLDYEGESGSLNEHLSDAFGVMARQWSRGDKDAASADWSVGAGVFRPGISGRSLRSMSEPGSAYDDRLLGKDVQPSHMSKYLVTSDDDGGVHTNSGIPNRAFYLACAAVGGPSWEAVGSVWYRACAQRLWADADFADFADLTVNVAGEMFGTASACRRAIDDAWRAVGLRRKA